MSQKSKILEHLRKGLTLSPVEALDLFGCFRLGARIMELRRAGFQIVDLGPSRGVNYSIYSLAAGGPLPTGAGPATVASENPRSPAPESLFAEPAGAANHDGRRLR